MTSDPHRIAVICCGVFQTEVTALLRRDLPDVAIRVLNSMLHMNPEKLALRLDEIVADEVGQGHKVLLVYGDCCMRMTALAELPGVARVRGNNCCDLLLGNDEYRRLSHEGAFFLFPEWMHRWLHIFTAELGLNRDNATSLMGDMHTRLVYLDTGVVPVPEGDLVACSRYCGLPWEVLKVSLEPLSAAIRDALRVLEVTGESP
jgi:hypothetical protein